MPTDRSQQLAKRRASNGQGAVDNPRTHIMRSIRKKNTRPEINVRRILHAAGYRFRLHAADLPGCPDIVLPKHRSVVLVHGCFWHQHPGCRYCKVPRTRPEYWLPKLARNVERDSRSRALLKKQGWRVLTLWECETQKPDKMRDKILRFLSRVRSRNSFGGS